MNDQEHISSGSFQESKSEKKRKKKLAAKTAIAALVLSAAGGLAHHQKGIDEFHDDIDRATTETLIAIADSNPDMIGGINHGEEVTAKSQKQEVIAAAQNLDTTFEWSHSAQIDGGELPSEVVHYGGDISMDVTTLKSMLLPGDTSKLTKAEYKILTLVHSHSSALDPSTASGLYYELMEAQHDAEGPSGPVAEKFLQHVDSILDEKLVDDPYIAMPTRK